MQINEPGIYRDFDVAAYHADPCPEPSLSQSIAKVLIDQSPLHAAYAHRRLVAEIDEGADEEKYDKAKAIGNAAHALMLGRGKDLGVGTFDDWRSKEARQFKTFTLAAGRIPIIEAHFEMAVAMKERARSQLAGHEEGNCFQNGAAEVALVWNEGPIWFRCLVDWLHDDLLTVDDFKTSAMSVAPHVLGTRAADAGWDIQAAMIERGLNVLDPQNKGKRKYRFVAIEQEIPNALNVMVITEPWLVMGRKKLQHAVDIWTECMTQKQWPGYPPVAVRPEYPGWKESQWLNREITAAVNNRYPPADNGLVGANPLMAG